MVLHTGGCHCGRVRFEGQAPSRLTVSECNCSMCSRSGYLHLIVRKSHFRLLQGEAFLTTYTFNTRTAQHLFCSACGVNPLYVPRSPPDGYSVNARSLDEGRVDAIVIEPINGREWEKQYPAGRGKLPDE